METIKKSGLFSLWISHHPNEKKLLGIRQILSTCARPSYGKGGPQWPLCLKVNPPQKNKAEIPIKTGVIWLLGSRDYGFHWYVLCMQHFFQIHLTHLTWNCEENSEIHRLYTILQKKHHGCIEDSHFEHGNLHVIRIGSASFVQLLGGWAMVRPAERSFAAAQRKHPACGRRCKWQRRVLHLAASKRGAKWESLVDGTPSLKLTVRPWKLEDVMSFWDGPVSGAMVDSGRAYWCVHGIPWSSGFLFIIWQSDMMPCSGAVSRVHGIRSLRDLPIWFL